MNDSSYLSYPDIRIKKFTFNPLRENTYVIFSETKHGIIIDPGCSSQSEQNALKQFVVEAEIKPVMVLNTHCHFDHVFGNNFVCKEYNIKACAHAGEEANIKRFTASAALFGHAAEQVDDPEYSLTDRQIIKLGDEDIEVIHTPGHSEGSVCFYYSAQKILISGDTLFAGSIGRTDLPGGNYEKIVQSLKKLVLLPDDTQVFCGHAHDTYIGVEKLNNPFIIEFLDDY
ncbi:MAG: MBL fold metallo-hydrolase [Prevotellaceae bacterium]|jgi:glyoxylase-like metal-dependent hydrolase (beta-lactamase superfamily II)|nr:MBL fold metallo-hydrolase [Prevotellaceae bacterium]